MSRVRRELIYLPWLVILAAGGVLLLSLLLPYPELAEAASGPWSLRVEDRNGVLLRVFPVDEQGLKREYLALEEVPPYLQRIFLAGEDKRFSLHPGIDPAAVLRASLDNLSAGRIVSGASTVTMQLAGRIRPRGAGLLGKSLEGWDALRLELRLSKREILTLWLNTLAFGSNVEGAASAAREYLGREVSLLTPAEAALLALVPRNPVRYDPRSADEEHVRLAAARLLDRAGIIQGGGELSAAISRGRGAEPEGAWPFRAPHFTAYAAENFLGDARRPLKTTLDPELQALLEAELSSRVEAAAENRIGNGAGIIIAVEGGEILAYAGSVDFNDPDHRGQIDGVRILRQPGSTMKPFLYAVALEQGMSPASLLPDVPLSFGGEAVYTPENFSNTYNGPVLLRTALASSLNIPAVYTVTRIGTALFADRLLDFGFPSIAAQRENLGAGIALGNAEVPLIELTAAFALFQRDGLYRAPTTVASRNEPERVLTGEVAFLIRDILSSNRGRIPGFGTRSVLNTPYPAIFKTGTSNQFNNIWALGATEKLCVGVWMGNFTGETVIGRPGSSLPAAVATAVLEAAQGMPPYAVRPQETQTLPAGIERVRICSLSGKAAGPFCPGSFEEYFRAGNQPEECDFHSVAGTRLPAEYREWASMKGFAVETAAEGAPRIEHPADGALFFLDAQIPAASQGLRVSVGGSGYGELFLDGRLIASGEAPLSARVPLERGEHALLLRTPGREQRSSYRVR